MTTTGTPPPVTPKGLTEPAKWGGEVADLRITRFGEAVPLNTVRPDVLDSDVAWTIEEVCDFFGGKKPINPATIYKWIGTKGFPKPFKVGPRTSRWLESEVVAYRRNKIQGRAAATPPVPTGKRKMQP